MGSGLELTFFSVHLWEVDLSVVGRCHAIWPQHYSSRSRLGLPLVIQVPFPGTGIHSLSRQTTNYVFGWFLFLYFGHFQIFPSKNRPNVSDRDMALMCHSLAQKPLIAPCCLSDKFRVPDLAFKAFWDLASIHLPGPTFRSQWAEAGSSLNWAFSIPLDFGYDP